MKILCSMLLECMTAISAFGQVVTIEQCKQLAHDHYPAVSQYQLIEQARDYTMDNAAKAWLPQVSANVSAAAFTDILSMDGPMRQLSADVHHQLATGSIMLRQNIYDGGKTKAQRQLTAATALVDQQQLDVTMYALNQRIEQLYFGILILDAQIRQNHLFQDDLALNAKTVEALMQGGMANQSDRDAVKVEQVKARQALESLQASRASYLRMLGLFVGKDLSGDSLSCPETTEVGQENHHPQLTFYQGQLDRLAAERQQLNARLRPTLSAFGMGMYHTKVTDMVKAGMLAAGVTFSWNIGSLYTRKNDLRHLDLKRQQVESQRETFLFNNRLQNEQMGGNIASLRRQLVLDDELVTLRQRLRTTGEKKVRFGTESINELLRQTNALHEARQQQLLHQLQLIREIYALKTNKGL